MRLSPPTVLFFRSVSAIHGPLYIFFMFINECTLLVLGIYCYKTNYSISGWKQHKHYLTVFVGQEPRSRLAGWGPLAQRLSWPTCGQERDSHPKTWPGEESPSSFLWLLAGLRWPRDISYRNDTPSCLPYSIY